MVSALAANWLVGFSLCTEHQQVCVCFQKHALVDIHVVDFCSFLVFHALFFTEGLFVRTLTSFRVTEAVPV